MEDKIKLGDQVKDLVSGYKGIATMRTKFLNGCIQYVIVGKIKPGQKPHEEEISVDHQSLKVIKRNVVPSTEYPKVEKMKEEFTGGRTRMVKRSNC